MADDDIKTTGNNAPNIKQNALNALNKARKESAEAKVKDKMKLLQEHQRAARQVEKEIEQIVEDYEQGL